jgi:hypothetical protein
MSTLIENNDSGSSSTMNDDDAYVYAPKSEHAQLFDNNHGNVVVVPTNTTTCRFKHRGDNSGPFHIDSANVCGRGDEWEMTKNSVWYKIERPLKSEQTTMKSHFLVLELYGVPTYYTLFRPELQTEGEEEECLSVVASGNGGFPDQVFEWTDQNDSLIARPFYLRVSPVFRRYKGIYDITIERYPCDDKDDIDDGDMARPNVQLFPTASPVATTNSSRTPKPTMTGDGSSNAEQQQPRNYGAMIVSLVALAAFALVASCLAATAVWWTRRQKKHRRATAGRGRVIIEEQHAYDSMSTTITTAPSFIADTGPAVPDSATPPHDPGDRDLLVDEREQQDLEQQQQQQQPTIPLVVLAQQSIHDNIGSDEATITEEEEEEDEDEEEEEDYHNANTADGRDIINPTNHNHNNNNNNNNKDDIQAVVDAAALICLHDFDSMSTIPEGSFDDSKSATSLDLVVAALEWT